MTNNETTWDKRLHIQTGGRDDTHSDLFRFPYEPTPYSVLERLADCGLIGKNDVVLDYGCGKGRVSFFLSHRTKAGAVGLEYDHRIYALAMENLETAKAGAEFIAARAEEFAVPAEVNRCYFFNPFSVEILRAVMVRILESFYADPRELLLFFYYPSNEYMGYLATVDELEFYDEIDCRDLFDGADPRERIMIFRLPGMDEKGWTNDK